MSGYSVNFLKKEYITHAGFTVMLAGLEKPITLAWRHLVNLACKLLVFGLPLDGHRYHHLCFRDKTNEGLIRRIYHNLVKETTGDAKKLGWSRVQKDSRKCYFSASRLVKIVHVSAVQIDTHGT